MNIDLLNEKLVETGLLDKVIYYEELESTNLYAKNHINSISENTIVLTSFQTKGTGRFGKEWNSSRNNNLSFTLIKNSDLRVDEIHYMNFYSSYILFLTVNHFISGYKDYELNLKWPNDILLNKKKIAGLLLEIRDLNKYLKKFIIGIGLNINQNDFPDEIKNKATSLKNETKSEYFPELILIKFIELFFENLDLLSERKNLMELWKSFSNVIGKIIKFKQLEDEAEITARVIDIDADGGLKVITEENKKYKYYSGEISLVY